jgi:uncharacterized protein (TIGR02246 family)
MRICWIVLTLLSWTPAALAFDTPQALQDAFMAALRAGDADAVAACYTADAVTFTPDRMIGFGPDAARESWGAFFQQHRVLSAELSEQHMTESGDLAAAWGLYTITAQPVGGGDPLVMQGRYMDVARNFDGRWLYIADHASVPLPAQQ